MVEVYEREDGKILLIRGFYPCPHRTAYGNQAKHIHYHVTSWEELKRLNLTLNQLIEWLEWGFWTDSFICHPRPIIERFYQRKCMGNVHFL